MALKIISLKIPEDELRAWDKEASRCGITRSELIRRRMGSKYIPDPEVADKKPPKPKGRGSCEHRLAPGTYCKSCGRTKT